MAVYSRFEHFLNDNGGHSLLVWHIAHQGLRARLRARRFGLDAHGNFRLPYVSPRAGYAGQRRLHTLFIRKRHLKLTYVHRQTPERFLHDISAGYPRGDCFHRGIWLEARARFYGRDVDTGDLRGRPTGAGGTYTLA